MGGTKEQVKVKTTISGSKRGVAEESDSKPTQQKTATNVAGRSGKSVQRKSVTSVAKKRQRATVTNKTTETFAEGLCFRKLFFIFLIGSVLGTIYEDVLIYVKTLMETGTGVWMIHRGVIYGPFNVIYGFGAALMCWILLRKKYNNWQIFGLSAILGGIVEYALSFLQETFTGTTSWDYSDLWLNLNGRTTIPIMLVWGVMGLALVKIVYPFISRLIEKIPTRYGTPIFWILLVFMILNCLISWTAIIRQNLRHQDVRPWTPIGEFYDDYYDDEYLQKYFPNMVRSGER